MRQLPDYADRYDFLDINRSDGVLTVRLHTSNGPCVWSQHVHQHLPMALVDIGADPSTRVIVLTGTGDEFIDRLDVEESAPLGEGVLPTGWNHHHRMAWEGERLLTNMLDIEVPIVAAINGPARIHAELALLADIVLASDTAIIGDRAHFVNGVVPGDGVHVIWPLLLGHNRARHFFYGEREFTAKEALDLGLVAEVLSPADLERRAGEIARSLARKPRLTLRLTRALLTRPFKKALLDELAFGIALEGMSIAAMKSEARMMRAETTE